MPNELAIGDHRIGGLVDFDPGTPPIDVALRRSKRGIFVDLPWRPGSKEYARWFLDDSLLGSEGVSAVVPRCLLFLDSDGQVLLVNCRSHTFRTDFSSGVGVITADYAVMGYGGSSFLAVNRLRWEVSGLRRWMGISSVSKRWDASAPQTVDIHVSPSDVVEMPAPFLVRFVPSVWFKPGDGDIHTIDDQLFVETTHATAANWADHEDIPRRLRDLLSISQWLPERYKVVAASRDDDPVRNRDGEVIGTQWRAVIDASRRLQGKQRVPKLRRDLVKFGDIGIDGIARWLEMCERYSRVIDPIASQAIVGKLHPGARLAQTGPAVEALGYFLKIEDGESERAAGGATLHSRFQRVALEVGDLLPFDASAWASTAPGIYNGVKHANRTQPEEVDILNAWADSVMALRAWLMLRLGVSRDQLRKRLQNDPQPRGFVPMWPVSE